MGEGVLERLREFTEGLDDFLRLNDLRAHRTVGGRLDSWFGIQRHTVPALALPSFLCALLVLGTPSLMRAGVAFVVAAVAFGGLAYAMRRSNDRRWPVAIDLVTQVGAVLLTAGALWALGPDEYQDIGVYRHVFIPLAAALSLSLLVASGIATLMFRGLNEHSRYGEYLKHTELFASRGAAPTVTLGTVLAALVIALFRAPLALLTLPAIVALLMPPFWLLWVTVPALLVCVIGLFVAGLNERFGIMWTLIQAVFFKGGALIVSLLIIVLAALRLMGVTYVTTVLDTAAWWAIGVALAGAYALSWWYDYWANRLLADQIIALIDPNARGLAVIPYPIDSKNVATSVPAEGRLLQIHGASRFVVINETATLPYFQSYTMMDLLDLLAVSGAPGGKAKPPVVQIRGRLFNFHSVTALLFVGIVGLGTLMLHDGTQLAEVTLRQDAAPGLSLDALLSNSPGASQDDRPLIVVAASGGGTRAAVYTAAVLEGIASLGRSADVVLGSGVSGGGAALAYFAANRPRLISHEPGAWNQYFDAMQWSYIQDVLDRASEWRMVKGGRLGILLAESFKRVWNLPPDRTRLEDIRDVGLIFNTSLAGHFDRPKTEEKAPFLGVERSFRRDTKSTLAGGRLLLTNLDLPQALSLTTLEPGATRPLPVILRSRDLRLEDAAALNANFPPVFSNAAIDVDDRMRYWITDGGAVDNRGLEMLLYAVRLSLAKRNGDQLPRLHIIVADASAFSDAYTQDRGVSSLAGAGSHLASQLDAELVADLRRIYEKHPDRFHFSYVMMPDRLRESGSFGTHWMLQPQISVRLASNVATVSGTEMIQIVRALHTPGAERQLSKNACAVFVASRADPSHQSGWQEFVTELGGAVPPPACVTQ